MSEKFTIKDLDKLNKKILNSKTNASNEKKSAKSEKIENIDNKEALKVGGSSNRSKKDQSTQKNPFEYAKTESVADENAKVYSSEVNKKNAKKKKMLAFLLVLLIIFLLLTAGLALYFFVFSDNGTHGPSQANFDINIYSGINEEPSGIHFYTCMPGDSYDCPLRIINNTEEAEGDVLVRFKIYIVDEIGTVYNNCIQADLENASNWYFQDETKYFYYEGVLSQLETLTIYETFGINEETSNELNGKQAQLILIVDAVEADIEAVTSHWSDSPVVWQLEIQETLQ